MINFSKDKSRDNSSDYVHYASILK